MWVVLVVGKIDRKDKAPRDRYNSFDGKEKRCFQAHQKHWCDFVYFFLPLKFLQLDLKDQDVVDLLLAIEDPMLIFNACLDCN